MASQIQLFIGNTNKSATESRRKSSFYCFLVHKSKSRLQIEGKKMSQSDLLTSNNLSSFTELFLCILHFPVSLNIISLGNLHLLFLLHSWLIVIQSCGCANLPSGCIKCLYTSWTSVYPKKGSIFLYILFVVKALRAINQTHQLHFTVYFRNRITLLCLKVTKQFTEHCDVSRAKQ